MIPTRLRCILLVFLSMCYRCIVWPICSLSILCSPALPGYEQTSLPREGYFWTPVTGRMTRRLFWVPEVVLPSEPGLFWTPGYWLGAATDLHSTTDIGTGLVLRRH